MGNARRPVSEGAERWLGVPIHVLDHGLVTLVDYMGTDESIVKAARISTNSSSKGEADDQRLIRYLMKHRHTSPFEMVELAFHIRLPIFVARQMVRHRTASLNEYSGRYSVLHEKFYFPNVGHVEGQSTTNRQSRTGPLPEDDARAAIREMSRVCTTAYHVYQGLLKLGVARELARIILPVNIYTEWVWKIDLHNLLHFLRLRLHESAQREIRDYAKAISIIVSAGWPLTWKAFDEYALNGGTAHDRE